MCMYMYMYVCVYMYIYIYICICIYHSGASPRRQRRVQPPDDHCRLRRRLSRRTSADMTIGEYWRGMIWPTVTWYDLIWSDLIWHDITWYDMTWYDMIWHEFMQYCVMPGTWSYLAAVICIASHHITSHNIPRVIFGMARRRSDLSAFDVQGALCEMSVRLEEMAKGEGLKCITNTWHSTKILPFCVKLCNYILEPQ